MSDSKVSVQYVLTIIWGLRIDFWIWLHGSLVCLSGGFLGIGDEKHLSGGGSRENKELKTARMGNCFEIAVKGI